MILRRRSLSKKKLDKIKLPKLPRVRHGDSKSPKKRQIDIK
jgi:hypothetical protein